LAGAMLSCSEHPARRRATSAQPVHSLVPRAAGASPRTSDPGAILPNPRGCSRCPQSLVCRHCRPAGGVVRDQPGRFLAADRPLRITESQSRPAPGFRCTCVTRSSSGKPPNLLAGHCQFDSAGVTAIPTSGGCRHPSLDEPKRRREATVGGDIDEHEWSDRGRTTHQADPGRGGRARAGDPPR